MHLSRDTYISIYLSVSHFLSLPLRAQISRAKSLLERTRFTLAQTQRTQPPRAADLFTSVSFAAAVSRVCVVSVSCVAWLVGGGV
jgi:hypothetical protein